MKLSLNDIEYVLAKANDSNVISLDGFNWEKASDNDKAKYNTAIAFGLISLHYLDCINKYNEGVE